MPIYEYQCKECGLRFERKQSFSDEPVRVCPGCGGVVQHLIHPVGIIFKESGFYVTDSHGSREYLNGTSHKNSAGDFEAKSGENTTDTD